MWPGARPSGPYGICFAPWTVGEGGTQWLDGFETVEEAMRAADDYVAAQRHE